jgi:hypothetical protein
MKFYLASRFEHQPFLCQVRTLLKKMGHEVTSRWLDVPADFIKCEATLKQAGEYADNDLRDIDAANIVLFDLTCPTEGMRGGCHVEFGYSLLMSMLVKDGIVVSEDEEFEVWVVGKKPTLFHHHADVRYFEDWTDAWEAINEL